MSERQPQRGLVLVNTGDGRGKSTSAFGVILRMPSTPASKRAWKSPHKIFTTEDTE